MSYLKAKAQIGKKIIFKVLNEENEENIFVFLKFLKIE